MARPYPRLVGANKISNEWQKINTIAQYAEETEARVDTILSEPDPNKDPELVDIRTPDPSYTPQRAINVAGDITRDMQEQFMLSQVFRLTGSDGHSKVPPYTGDVNNLKDTGMYGVTEAATNTPTPTLATLLVYNQDGQHIRQVWHAFWGGAPYENRVYTRSSFDGGITWTSWAELITSRGGTITGQLVLEMPLNLNNALIMSGAGSPEGVVTAPVGSLYLRTDSGTLYVKSSGTGNTGWTAK